jgi:uncharacterized membrane protein
MPNSLEEAAQKLFGMALADLGREERIVLEKIAARGPVSRDVMDDLDDDRTFGERLADQVATFAGSWTFIIAFFAVLVAWMMLNMIWLGKAKAFDPYPFILLNLGLSMLAAVQAPLILMSQNRQAVQDRIAAKHDYEVNLKAELEILSLHDKLDQMRTQELKDILARVGKLEMPPATAALKQDGATI